jgi:nucleotide-binding universal stress UspA family protein
LATDRSAASRAALLAVAGLASGAGIQVVVLAVDEGGRLGEARRLVDDISWGLIALAVDTRGEVRRAAPAGVAAEIAAAADEHQADLVVLGARGRSDFGGLLLGATGRQVVERVHCPVLLVRAGRRASGRRRRLLVALAGDEHLPELTRAAAAVAEQDTRALVLPLFPPAQRGPRPDGSDQLVDRMVAGLRRCGVRARGHIGPSRHDGDQAMAAARGYGADLVVVGSRRLPALVAQLLGSTSEEVDHDPAPALAGASAPATVSVEG